MCLYEKIIKNPRYEISIKNGGNVPEPKDERQRYIKIKCGWCKECRKELSNEWRARLFEELKVDKTAYFVTLSISAKMMAKLEKELHDKKFQGIEGEDTDVNILAAYAIRMFAERWRKKYQKAPKHWFTTELGHTNSERLHIHGLIWKPEKATYADAHEDIFKKWQYGNVYIGWGVNNSTINYISKYITKTDKQHKGYKQKIFTSKGIGKDYVDKNKAMHTFKWEMTRTYYKCPNGAKITLPQYWKRKLWNDDEREKLWSMQLDKQKVVVDRVEWDLTRQDEAEYREKFQNQLKKARETNENLGYGNPTWNNRRYIITDIMKMEWRNLKETMRKGRETIKFVNKRELINIIERKMDNKQELSKAMGTTLEIYGDYTGTTTATERKKNAERAEAKAMKVTVKQLRLIKAGIITNLV